ncbi:protein PALS1-like isoform X4 [Amphibalanus amphitrite]|nr:protein PALS1-like isoform X4 [Amphibalanus amphitrite]
MTRLSQQLSDTEKVQESSQLNGIIESNSVYVTSVPALSRGRGGGEADGPVRHPSGGGGGGDSAAHDSLDASGEQLELNQLLGKNRASAPAGEQATRSQCGSRRETGEKREPRERREISEEREKRERRDRSEEREKRERREKSEERDKRERREKSEESNKRDRNDKSEGRQKSEERERREKHERREAAERLGQSAASAESGHSGEAMSSRCNGNGRVVDDPAANTRLRSKAFITHNDSKRSSKESLSSHKSSRSSGARSRASSVEQLQLEAVMSELDRGPHREMAVDVPESFVARTKTPPRYPPPRAPGTGTAPRPGSGSGSGAAPRPEPPAPAPRPSLDRSRGSSTASRDSEPGREQMERIRKYQEDIRRDREMRDKRSKEEEFLRSSLRGSEKMKRLEHKPAPTGFVNNGYDAHAHDADHVTAPGGIDDSQLNVSNLSLETTILNKLYPSGVGVPPVGTASPAAAPSTSPRQPSQVNRLNSGRQRAQVVAAGAAAGPRPRLTAAAASTAAELAELLASLKQIQRALKASGAGLQQELAVAQSLLTSPEFQRVLAVHNKVQEIWCFNAPPSALCFNAQDVAQEVVGVLQESSSPEAVELVDLLTRFDMEGLLYSHDQIAARGSPADSGEPEPAPALDDYAERVHHYTDPRVRVIRLEKTNEPLGATVKNEGDSVLVGRIVKGGAADKSGLLRPGDEILEVNGIEMRGKSVDDVCDILAGMTGSLVFLALPRDEQEEPEKTKPPQAVLHVKAHFDYDPEDDIYMPCREIGMSFQKGDILHVTSQEDPDWWQATRDGDEDLPLSGLIPSLSFQTQRETLKQSIIDSSRKEGKKNKFLCAKRTNKKKRKMYNAEYNDDYEANEILTYEEVGLYYPRANHKRPVVLIGPPNIGRHELRQKLMEDTERFSAAVPHTSRPRKDTEVDGQDYHFISRPQFEQDIVNRLFVEHGEYERAYYGTSVSAIRTVVNSSKICVLNLHPHSLKILKTTDLKPFVVFVAPPSLEKLRQLKQKAGEQVRDDELKQIIEKAREIEEVYGHYFDIVIINSDLNRAYEQLIHEINTLEREPQWVPASWLRQDLA